MKEMPEKEVVGFLAQLVIEATLGAFTKSASACQLGVVNPIMAIEARLVLSYNLCGRA